MPGAWDDPLILNISILCFEWTLTLTCYTTSSWARAENPVHVSGQSRALFSARGAIVHRSQVMSRGVTNTFTQTHKHLCDKKNAFNKSTLDLYGKHNCNAYDGPVFMILVMFLNSEERRSVSVRGARGSRLWPSEKTSSWLLELRGPDQGWRQ